MSGTTEQKSLVPYTYKVVVLGPSNAGKTTFLASMFRKLSIPNPDINFTLRTTTSENQEELNKRYDSIAKGIFLPGTDKISEWKFNCIVRASYPVMQISYLDYAGGKLLEPGSIQYKMLVEHIQAADVLLIILDGAGLLDLLQEKPKSEDFFDHDLINIFQCLSYSNAPIHFVITKWDILEPTYSLNTVKGRLLANNAFRSVTVSQKNRVVRLIPVSAVGKGFAKWQPNGKMEKIPGKSPEPFNVEVPLACILIDQFAYRLKQQIAKVRESQTVPSFLARRISWRFLIMLTGGTAQFLQSIPTHPYLIGGTIALDRLLDFVERVHVSAGKKRRRIEQMRKEQEQSLGAIENLQDAVDSAAKSCMRLVWKFEYDFPDSLLS